MKIKQFKDSNLSHYSYAIVSNGKMALVDPARDPQPYYDYAAAENAVITAVIETHPHADFVSSHLEIHQTTGATIYVSRLLGAEYPHEAFDDGNILSLGNILLKAINTPGHSPDSISILAVDKNGKAQAVFTGDTLFAGDCGRPDLREEAGAITASRESLAKQMYHSLRQKLMTLPGDVIVYPAHGAGSLCGKGLGAQDSSTIGEELQSNWSLQPAGEEEFVKQLLADQPFIPKYFTFDVGMNRKGAPAFAPAVNAVKTDTEISCASCARSLDPDIVVIDTRPQDQYKKSHLRNSINLMNDTRFETWLGSIINPGEKFYLAGSDEQTLRELTARIARIGYESQIEEAFALTYGDSKDPEFDSSLLLSHAGDYTIVDTRNHSEVKAKQIFAGALHIPLHELRERTNEIPTHKPVVVHCAGGYRSAAASSILKKGMKSDAVIYDLSEAVKQF